MPSLSLPQALCPFLSLSLSLSLSLFSHSRSPRPVAAMKNPWLAHHNVHVCALLCCRFIASHSILFAARLYCASSVHHSVAVVCKGPTLATAIATGTGNQTKLYPVLPWCVMPRASASLSDLPHTPTHPHTHTTPTHTSCASHACWSSSDVIVGFDAIGTGVWCHVCWVCHGRHRGDTVLM